MRTLKDLIDELQEKSQGSWLTMILVGFEKETKFVFHNSKDPLSELKALVKAGGEPVAICRIEKTGKGGLSVKVAPLQEYANEEWIYQYLEGWITNVMKTAKTDLGAEIESFDIHRFEPDSKNFH